MDHEMGFRKNYRDYVAQNDELTVFRPNDRRYPSPKGYPEGMIVKARIIETPGSDEKGIRPQYLPGAVELFKIRTAELLTYKNLSSMKYPDNIPDIQDHASLILHLKAIYGEALIDDANEFTLFRLQKIHEIPDSLDNSHQIHTLFEKGILRFAELPENNIKNIDELMKLDAYSLALIDHDYAGMTPKMWNAVTKEFDLKIGTTMVVADPKNIPEILDFLRHTKKYIGGGFGVGFKDKGFDFLQSSSYGYVNPLAEEMGSINFGAHFGDEIHGFNSDAVGYVTSLSEKFESIGKKLKGSSILVLGAGGTGRGICFELLNQGAKNIVIINRTLEKAQEQAEKLNSKKAGVALAFSEASDITTLLQEYNIDAIVNVSTKGADGKFEQYNALTPTSISPDESQIQAKMIVEAIEKRDTIFSDINLTKNKTTPFLDLAQANNFSTLDGKKMVVYQGVEVIWMVLGHILDQKGITKKDVFKIMSESVFGKE